ncbi:aldehyde dehydrogenase family protein [Streptomyces sp. NPDC006365]
MIASWKIAPALACGNTVIVKPQNRFPTSPPRCLDILRHHRRSGPARL